MPDSTRGSHDRTAAGTFEEHRGLLMGVAYRVLGSVSDAEDVVQDAWLRWSGVDHDSIEEPRSFLVTVTTRLAIDRLRRRRARKETYAGTWLPEPVVTGGDPDAHAQLSESLALGLLLVLETLSPLERAVFVLRDAFGYEYVEIAAIVGRREAAVRQLAHRARRHVKERRPRYTTDPATHRRVTDRFVRAAASGDMQGLVDVLAPDVMLIADGGGKVRAPLLPVVGAEQVIRFLLAVAERNAHDLRAEVLGLNGSPGIVVTVGEELVAAIALELDGELVRVIHLVADPDKLRRSVPPRSWPADVASLVVSG